MSDSRKVVIHIGNHKTGTTSIQRCLFRNRACFEEQGYSLFSFELDGSLRDRGNVRPWLGSGRKGVIGAELPDALAAQPGNIVLSSEGFSWVYKESQVRSFFEGLKNHFEEIEIVCYLRRQDLHAVSHFQQGSKNPKFYAAKFYAQGNRALPSYRPEYQRYLDYNQRMGIWGDIFGDSSLRLRLFERDFLKNGDVVEDFFSVAGLEYQHRGSDKNISLDLEATKIAHLMNRCLTDALARRRIMKELREEGGRKSQPSRHDAEAFYGHFRESNKRLNERFALNEREFLFDDDFSMYPENPADIWSDETANSAIGKLLAGVSLLPLATRKDMALMRKCVEQLSAIEPELSTSLKLLADRLEAE